MTLGKGDLYSQASVNMDISNQILGDVIRTSTSVPANSDEYIRYGASVVFLNNKLLPFLNSINDNFCKNLSQDEFPSVKRDVMKFL